MRCAFTALAYLHISEGGYPSRNSENNVALLDLIKFETDAEKTQALRAKLAQAVLDTQGKLAEAREAFGDAAADEAQGFGGQAQVNETEKALAAASAAANQAKAALSAFDARQSKSAASQEEDDLRGKWNQAALLAEERHAILEQIDKDVKTLADSVRAFEKKTADLLSAIPVIHDRTALLVDKPDFLGRLTVEMSRHGLRGDSQTRVVFDQPTLLSFAKGIPGMVRGWRKTSSNSQVA